MRRHYYSKSKVIVISLAILLIAVCLSFSILKVQTMQTSKSNSNVNAIGEGPNMQSEIYTIDDRYISRILPETTLRDLKNNLDNESITVSKTNGTLVQDTEFIGTGMKLVYGQKEYKLSVVGDLNGDGKAGITDLTQMKLSSVGLRAKPVNEYAKAGDINNDGKISITDLTKINLATVNLIDILAPVSFTPEVISTKDTITVLGETADSNSGVKEYWFEINNNGWVSNTDKLNNKYTFTGLNMETKYTIRMKVVDNAGNTKITKRVGIETLNEENANISIVASTAEWTNQSILVAINFNSNVAKEKKQVSLDNGSTWVDYTAPITAEKNMTIKARVVNSSGDVLEEQEKAITNIDKLEPQKVETIVETTENNITITVDATDADATTEYGKSEIKEYEYTLINGRWKDTYVTTDTTYTFSDLTLGTEYIVKVKAIDNAGNERIAKEDGEKIRIGTIDDLIELAGGIIINATPSTENWTNGDITVEVTYPDIDGLTKEISIDNGYSWKTYSGVETIEGNTTVKARMKDSKGQTSTEESLLIDKIDKLPPKAFDVIIETTGDTITLTASTADAEATNRSGVSGIAGYKFKINEEEWTEVIENGEHTFTGLTEGETYKIIVKAVDNAGNETIANNCKNGGMDVIPTLVPDYYGKEVTNYTEGGIKWRVYHKDDGNIYLISDDYIAYNNLPTSTVGTSLNKGTTNYQAYFTDIVDNNDYTGSEWIINNTDEKAQKWLDTYLKVFPNSINPNIKAVAFMMDTDKWSEKFANSDMAEYAIGGPTIELFCASYKTTHPNRYIEYDMETYSTMTYGYRINWSDGSDSNYIEGLTQNDFDKIYIKSDKDFANGMWIAAPMGISNYGMLNAYYNGGIHSCIYETKDIGFRPIVCIKSGYDLVKNDGTDTYRIEDKGKPTLTVEGNTDEWSKTKTLTITATDAESGIASVTVDGISQTLADGAYTYTASTNGTYTIVATDNNGNTTTEVVEITKIDNTAPTIEFSKQSNSTELATQEVGVTVTEEGSGIKTCKYLWSENEYTPTDESYYEDSNSVARCGDFKDSNIISTRGLSGNYYLHVYLEDNLGNKTTTRTTGTFKFKYEISNEEELIQFLNNDLIKEVNSSFFSGKTVYIVDNITMSAPREYITAGFNGTLEGGNHTISGLNVDYEGPFNITGCGGLFAVLNSTGTIKDLGIINTAVKSNVDSVGGFVGQNKGTIQNCYFQGEVEGNNSYYIGGIAGRNEEVITNCYTKESSSVTNAGYTGGIVGYNCATIRNCYNYATVRSSDDDRYGYAGGIAGSSMPGGENECEFKNCYNMGNVQSVKRAGGIIGEASGLYNTTNISNCYNTGNIRGNSSVGGIAGGIAGMDTTTTVVIRNTYNLGNVSSYTDSTSCSIGGICGSISRYFEIYNSHNEGNIGNGQYFGGIIGYSEGDISTSGSKVVSNCKYKQGSCTQGFGRKACDVAGQAEVTTSMPNILTVLGSGFKADSRNINNGYPILSWQ